MRILLILMAALLLNGCASTSEHYRIHGDGPSLFAVMHQEIRNGQSLSQVRSRLGEGLDIDQAKLREIHERILAKRPSMLPDGVEDKDLFVAWRYDGGPWQTLQFRDDRLVNHNPEHYETYRPFRSVRD